MDADFFEGFTKDLCNKHAWAEFHGSFRNEKKKLKNIANPTQLGDHVSLKAEAADSTPTDQDKGAKRENSSSPDGSSQPSANPQDEGRPSLSKLAKDTTIGDPVSLESEDVVESSKQSAPQSGPSPEVQKSNNSSPSNSTESELPRIPSIDGESLFWSMMSVSREPDPYVFPALQQLSKQQPRPIIGALSNTVIYPTDHPWSKQMSGNKGSASSSFFFDPHSFFDVYVASAEVGMRKPSPDIYKLAIKRLDDFDRQKGGSGVNAEEIVFLDDIGENLKTAKEMGMKTIRVQLGKTWRAVKELEGILGVELMDEKTRRSKL